MTMRHAIRPWCLLLAFGVAVGPGGTDAQERGPVRVYVFAPEEPDAGDPVRTNLPDWVPTDFVYFFDAEEGRKAASALVEALQDRPTRRQLMRVTDSPEDADVYLEIVATAHGLPEGERHPLTIVRLSLSRHDYTTDFLGGALRRPDSDGARLTHYDAAQEIERWIDGNYDQLLTLIRKSP